MTEFGRREQSLNVLLVRMRCLCLKNTEYTGLLKPHYANSKLILFAHLKLRSKAGFNFIHHVLTYFKSYETECVGENIYDSYSKDSKSKIHIFSRSGFGFKHLAQNPQITDYL